MQENQSSTQTHEQPPEWLKDLLEKSAREQEELKKKLEESTNFKAKIEEERQQFSEKTQKFTDNLVNTENQKAIERKKDNTLKKVGAGVVCGGTVGFGSAVLIGTAGLASPLVATGLGIGLPVIGAVIGGGIGGAIGISEMLMQEIVNAQDEKQLQMIFNKHKAASYILCTSTCIVLLGKSLKKIGSQLGEGLPDWARKHIANSLNKPQKENITTFVNVVLSFSDAVIDQRDKLEKFFTISGTNHYSDACFHLYEKAEKLSKLSEMIKEEIYSITTRIRNIDLEMEKIKIFIPQAVSSFRPK